MTKQRIQVYADHEIKRRIVLAAAKYDIPVTEYCLSAIERQLIDDDLLEHSHIHISVNPGIQSELVENLHTLQGKILARRNGTLFDVDDALQQARAERDCELLGLR